MIRKLSKEDVLNVIQDGEELKLSEIVERVGYASQTVQIRLRQLRHERKLICVGPNPWLYSLWGDTQVVVL